MMLIQIAANAVHAKLVNADSEAKRIVSEALSYVVEGAEFSDAFKTGSWDGRSSFFNWGKAGFPAGFVHLVHDRLVSKGYRVQVVRRRPPAPLGPEDFANLDGRGVDSRYDYQAQTVELLLKHGSMIAQLATGAGKSRVAQLAVARIRRPTLFITTRSVLMHQMRERFDEMGFTCGVMGDGEWSPRRGVNVAMVQTLIARLSEGNAEREWEAIVQREREAQAKASSVGARFEAKSRDQIIMEANERARVQNAVREKTKKILEFFEFVIGEEAHEAGSASYYEITRHCRNAHYRLALTATPFMRPDAEANMRLMACFGPIGIEVSEDMLIERGILATPWFKRVQLPCPPKLRRSTPWQRAYELGITGNEARNRHIVMETVRAAGYGLTSLILVQRKAHGQVLKDMLKAAGLRVEYIFGEHDQDRRQRALQRLRDGDLDALVGSTILDVGVDVPAVGMIVLAGGGKAEVALRQRIGRGLRAKKSGPNVALIVDFDDCWNEHLRTHSRTRFQIVDQTPGFRERVLTAGADFDYGKLGFERAPSPALELEPSL